MSTARSLGLVFLLLSAAAWSREAASPPAAKATAATLKRDSSRCATNADLNACYDAIRWNPGDPALLVALADALVRAKRPADAIRYYQRAVLLAPNMRGVDAKISAAEAKASSKRAAVIGTQGKRYSNASPEAQSH
jgi:cytochrome c-type biogenesis protein CcmH/NrfG